MQSILHPIVGPKKEITDLHGRTAVVLGGANGIGFQISRAFALEGCHVIMVNRKEEQGTESIEDVKKEKADAKIEWEGCDLGNLKEVKQVFEGIRQKLDRLDIFVASAGINTNTFGLDHDGIDRHFGVNWLGQFYALNILYPTMRKTSKMPDTPAPRIVFESSEVHRMARNDIHFGSLEELNDENYGPNNLYARSKIAMILGAKFGILEKVIKPNSDNIYVLSVHPGMVRTGMQQQWKDAYPGLFGKLVSWSQLAMGRDVEQGSYSALYAATSPEVEEKGWNGYYLIDPGQEGKETAQANDRFLGIALWELSHRLIKDKVGQDALTDWNA